MNCLDCEVELTPNNAHPSQLKRNIRLCKKCSRKRNKTWHKNNPDRHQEIGRRNRMLRRRKIIVAYGGACYCTFCDETTPEFLAIAHLNGNGKAHRESLGDNPGTTQLYSDLEKRGYPKEFELEDGTPIRIGLYCHNCHYAKDKLGYCPHNTEFFKRASQRWIDRRLTEFEHDRTRQAQSS